MGGSPAQVFKRITKTRQSPVQEKPGKLMNFGKNLGQQNVGGARLEEVNGAVANESVAIDANQ